MKKSRALIILAILLTLVSTFFLYRYIESLRKVPEVQVKYTNVVVAVNDIAQSTKLTEAMLKLESVPEEAVHPDSVKTIAELVDKITKADIFKGEQILNSKLAATDEKTGLSYKIPENMRAIVVPTTEVTGLAGYLQKGDKVDIIVTYQEAANRNPGASTTPTDTTTPTTASNFFEGDEKVLTVTQLQNIEVLEVGIVAIKDETGKLVKAQGVPTSVTLLVTPQQAEVVAFMLKYGTFQMTLRNPVDGVKVPLDHYGKDNFDDWRNR